MRVGLVDLLTDGHHAGYVAATAFQLVGQGHQACLILSPGLVSQVRQYLDPSMPLVSLRGGPGWMVRAKYIAKASKCDVVRFLQLDGHLREVLNPLLGGVAVPEEYVLHRDWGLWRRGPKQSLRRLAVAQWLASSRVRRVLVHARPFKSVIADVPPSLSGKLEPVLLPPSVLTRIPERRPVEVEPDMRYVLAFGVIRPEKRPELFVDIANGLPDNITLIVAGEMSHLLPSEVAQRLRTSRRLRLIDRRVEEQEAAFLFANATAVLLAYSGRFDGLSGVAADAMAFGRPIVLAGAPGLLQATEGYANRVVATDDDPRTFAHTLSRVLDVSR